MFCQLVILCSLFGLLSIWFTKQRSSDPPEFTGGLPIIGHAYLVMKTNGVAIYDVIKTVSMEILKSGKGILFYLGPCKLYGISDPEDCITLMDTFVQKHYFYDYLKPLLGNGLATSDVETWKQHRKLLNPAFNQQTLNSFIDIFNSQAQRLVDLLGTEIGKPLDHQILLRINNLETICLTSFGVEANEYKNLLKQYLVLLHNLLENASYRILRFWLHSDIIYNMTQQKKNQDEELNHLLKLSKLIIQKKKSEISNHTNEGNNAGKCKAFMDLILDLAHETGCFTDDQIREHTNTIIFGGHDTSASNLTMALTILGSRSDIQEKAYEEILQVLGNSYNQTINKNDLSKLVYIEAILKETLRLHPIVPLLVRKIDKDVKLKHYTVKAYSNCIVSIYGLHRHSIWGPDADQFRPERWLDKETLPDPKYFGGFGLGRRSCIGKVYAMMSMKITLAHVLRNYRVSSDVSKMVERAYIIAKPDSGYEITLELRNN